MILRKYWENVSRHPLLYSSSANLNSLFKYSGSAPEGDIDEIWDELKNCLDRIIDFGVTSLIAEKKSLFDFNITRSVLIRSSWNLLQVDMDRISDKLETWPDRIICQNYVPLIVGKKAYVSSAWTCSVLIAWSWNMQIMWIWMKSLTN